MPPLCTGNCVGRLELGVATVAKCAVLPVLAVLAPAETDVPSFSVLPTVLVVPPRTLGKTSGSGFR